MLADPRIFVLDEATSSIDTQTEQLIQQAIDHLLRDRTSFLIAHRLSTIRKADMILVVRDGRIVEQGTHQELLRRRGYYHDLYSKQFAEEICCPHSAITRNKQTAPSALTKAEGAVVGCVRPGAPASSC